MCESQHLIRTSYLPMPFYEFTIEMVNPQSTNYFSWFAKDTTKDTLVSRVLRYQIHIRSVSKFLNNYCFKNIFMFLISQ